MRSSLFTRHFCIDKFWTHDYDIVIHYTGTMNLCIATKVLKILFYSYYFFWIKTHNLFIGLLLPLIYNLPCVQLNVFEMSKSCYEFKLFIMEGLFHYNTTKNKKYGTKKCVKLPCVSGIVTFITNDIEPQFFSFSFALSKPLTFIIH